MGRLFYHLFKGASESGSVVLLAVLIIAIVAYFVIKNKGNVVADAIVDTVKKAPTFTEGDCDFFMETFFEICRVLDDDSLRDRFVEITGLYDKDLTAIPAAELQEMYNSIKDTQIALMSQKDSSQIRRAIADTEKCKRIFKRRVEQYTECKLD